MGDFLKILKILFYVIFISPAIIGLGMIATGNDSNSKSAGSWKEKRIEYEKQRKEQERLKDQSLTPIGAPIIPLQNIVPIYRKTTEPSPEDAYDEGYSNGHEQGVEDGRRGKSHGYGYDSSSNYYNHYETMYEDGYDDGYNDGYNAGRLRYEEDDIY